MFKMKTTMLAEEPQRRPAMNCKCDKWFDTDVKTRKRANRRTAKQALRALYA